MEWISLQADAFGGAVGEPPRFAAGSHLSANPTRVAAFHYIHPAYRSVFMYFLLSPFHVRGREKSSWTLLVRNRPTIFMRNKFVIYFSTLCSNVEVALCKNLQKAAKIASLAACKVNRTDLLLLLPKIFNHLAQKFLASGRRTFAIR